VLCVAPEAHNKAVTVVSLDARGLCSPAGGLGPLAARPKGLPHLAALGHLKAVQGVAMRTKETSHEVVTPAVFAASCVELLPPVLVVASVFVDRDDFVGVAFAWLCTDSAVEVVQGVLGSCPVCLETDQKVSMFARRPAPLVERQRPICFPLRATLRALTGGAVQQNISVASAFSGDAITSSFIATFLGAGLEVTSGGALFLLCTPARNAALVAIARTC